tara:strand:+ start:410 stop:757 length:348 start_codon:yes stop_codon:yes gene_type:complete
MDNIKKANNVTSHLVNNWYISYLISKANNTKFFAILQPYNYHLDSFEIKLFEKIYPLIKNKINEKCLLDKAFCSTFVDGSKWINPNLNYFIDDHQLIEEGNEVVADKIINLKNKK